MSKKRPRKCVGGHSALSSKWQPDFWRRRLFKNSYTINGRRFRTRKWCVKLQHLRQRKTFSLHSADAAQAAAEACTLYRAIVTDGWEAAAVARPPGWAKSQLTDG